MAKVTAIINARPLVPVSTDPDSPFFLSPAIHLTQRAVAPRPAGDFTYKDFFKSQWRQVQALAGKFWTCWSREYLPTVQYRRKWDKVCRDLQHGDVVLLKDSQVAHNDWPMALVTSAFPSRDEKVHKIEVKTSANSLKRAEDLVNRGNVISDLTNARRCVFCLPDVIFTLCVLGSATGHFWVLQYYKIVYQEIGSSTHFETPTNALQLIYPAPVAILMF